MQSFGIDNTVQTTKFQTQTEIPKTNKYTANQTNLLFFKSLIVVLSVKIETKNVKINAKKHSKNPRPENLNVAPFSKNSNKKPPTMIGTLIKKLNSAESISLFPQKVSVEMVVPERDNPGKTANPCAMPTAIAE